MTTCLLCTSEAVADGLCVEDGARLWAAPILIALALLAPGCIDREDGRAPRYPCAVDAQCKDADPCTSDKCRKGRCVHTFQCETPLGS